MNNHYSAEKNVQMLLSLMKAHNIKKVVVSPGMKNMCVVGSLQSDPYFELFSCVDERSAAYIACGLAAESGEPVALSCTGATASRNYMSALTEAFYRKLPILAITSTTHVGEIGQLIPQIIDRRAQLNDIVVKSVQIPMIRCEKDYDSNNILINDALLSLRHNGGGPVHINIETLNTKNFDIQKLPDTRVIKRVGYMDDLPELKKGKVGIFVGAHKKWSEKLVQIVDRFCECYDAVVLCDHTSNYNGKYGVFPAILTFQDKYSSNVTSVDTLIHIGEVSGAYIQLNPQTVWRVSPDGQIRDTFGRLKYIFEMEEEHFFEQYISKTEEKMLINYYSSWKKECDSIREEIKELPFSNAWIAKECLPQIPNGSLLLLGILNSLRNWNFFEPNTFITGYSNTGGFGIDGLVSTLIGMSLVNEERLCFGVVGDLAFFYDMNSLGNRHIGKNIRLMIINNGRGIEFRNYGHPCNMFGEDADLYMAAAGHFGNQSSVLVRHYAEDLGFRYISASSKEEFVKVSVEFLNPKIGEKSIIFEVFTDYNDESKALEIIRNTKRSAQSDVKSAVKNILGERGVKIIKTIID